MCGICGVISFDAQPVQEGRLHRSCDAMRHRGPDDLGTWCHAGADVAVGLGAVRLAVQDPTMLGHQPMLDPAKRFTLVFNGEVYNFRDLRRELDDGTQFVSQCDTEVVLHACIKWGADAVHRFNGMWALGFYDAQTRSGFLSRDRFGIKPLFYCNQNRELLFASELRALTAMGLRDRGIDPHALVEHLQFGFIGQPATIYNEVRRLPPGHTLVFDRQGAQEPVRYFDPLAGVPDSCADADGDFRPTLRRTMAEAVAARRVSDVPIGAFLSGGLDSSIVVAHLSEALGRRIKTFSVGYAGLGTYDESAYARMVANRFGTEHHEIVLTERDALEAIPKVLDHLGEPVGDASIIPTALVSEFAARSVTVALSGDGADELFGGYWRYLGHSAHHSYRALPRIVRKYIIEPAVMLFGSSKSSRLGNRVRQIRKLLRSDDSNALARHIAWSRILSPEVSELLNPSDRSLEADRRSLQRAEAMTEPLANRRDPLARVLAYDLLYQLPADMLHKVDLAGMMHSLEVRVPFLDPSVVSMALALPASAKVHRGMRKRALVETYRGQLPDAVLDRPKQGFELPIGEFLRGGLRELFHDTVDRETVESIGLVSYDAVQRIYGEHMNRRAEHADVLFALLSLCWWWRRERSQAASTA